MANNQAILPLDDYVAACDAVRAKGGTTSAAIKSGDMAAAITAISGPKPEQEKTASTTKNGAVEVTPDPGKVMTKATVIVNVPERKPEQAYNKTYTSNGSYPITPDPGKVITGGTIKVDVPSKAPVIKPKTITENGTFNAADEGADGYSPVTVEVPAGGGGVKSFVVNQFTDAAAEGICMIYGSSSDGAWDGFGYAVSLSLLELYQDIKIQDVDRPLLNYTSVGGGVDSTGLRVESPSDQFDVIAMMYEGTSERILYDSGSGWYYADPMYTAFSIVPKADGAIASNISIGTDL